MGPSYALSTTPGSPEWSKHYEAADQAAQASLAHNSKFHELGGHHPTVWFNRACSWALHGLFPIERAVAGKIDLVPDLRANAIEKWINFADAWRGELDAVIVNELDKQLEFCMNESIKDLDKMISGPKDVGSNLEDNFIAPTNPGFLVRLAETDADLAVFRTDTKYRKKILNWLKRHRSDMSIVSSFDKLKRHLPWDSPPEYFQAL